jgi:site-specific DNA-methyltransferase (adenine-specific)
LKPAVSLSSHRKSWLEKADGQNGNGIGSLDRFPLDTVVNGDSALLIKEMPSSSVHLILSDIPYGIGAEDWDVLHDNTNSAYLGSSPAQEKAGAIFKKRGKPINGWSEADRDIPKQYYEWCSTWATEWFRVIKPGGTVFIFAGRRFSHRCICALEDVGFSFKDMLAWVRDRAPHRAQRVSVVFDRRGDTLSSREWEGWRVGNLRPSFEPILWFTKPYKIGTTIADNALNHGVGPYNENAFLRYVTSPDNILQCGFTPREGGLHPTQKPVRLMQALIELTTKPGQIVLDPFAGSGSTLVAARNLFRHFIGYEVEQRFVEICKSRLDESDQLPFTK